jgi:superfamily II DNA or RNA helicase
MPSLQLLSPSYATVIRRLRHRPPSPRAAVVLFDGGQGIAAEETAHVPRGLHAASAQGIALTATPYRADGRDLLELFRASVQEEAIGAASIGEVMATGRIIPS